MEGFKKRQISFVIQLIAVTGILLGLHVYLLSYFADSITFFFPVWQIYAFHFIITLLFYSIINYAYSSGKKNIIILFMVMTFLKMALAIIFLLPLLLSDVGSRQSDMINFFIPYFLYLFFEILSISKFLQKQ